MRVMLATDGSRDAQAATLWLRDSPLAPGATVLVCTVAAVPLSAVADAIVGELRGAAVEHAGRIVEQARATLAMRASAIETRVVDGEPGTELVKIAEEWGAELVVVGARGLGGVKGLLVGSVSLAVARAASCPVVVVKGTPRPLRNAVVAVDGSAQSLAALAFLATLAPGADLSVGLVGVVEPLALPALHPKLIRRELRALLAQYHAERKVATQGALGRAAASVPHSFKTVELLVRSGRPGTEIVRTAASRGADLIVVGARGLGGVKRLLLGSVSEQVLREARCPVLVVRAAAMEDAR